MFADFFDFIGLDPGYLLLVLVGFPLSVLGLSELLARARRRKATYAGGIRLLRNVALPLFALYVLATQLAELPPGAPGMKILVTLTALVALVAIIGIVNGVFFGGGSTAVANVPKLFLDLARLVIVAIGVAVVLSSVWDFDLGELVTALGVSSIVLGLALQDTLGNLFSGITLLYEKPFSEGDFIVVGDVEGRVVEVNWRAVRLYTREKDMIVMPHVMVAQSAIVNRSRPIVPWAQKLEIGFSYDDAPNRVKDILFEVLDETPGVLAEPAAEVKTIRYNDSSIDYEVEYFISSFAVNEEVRDAFMTRVWYAAQRHGLNIPFPIRTLYHHEPKSDADHGERLRAYLDEASRMLSPQASPPLQIPAAGAKYEHYGIGEQVIPFGKRAEGLFLVLDGEADLVTLDRDGDRVNVVHLARGDFFSEIVSPGTRRGVIEVVAATDLELVHVSERQLRRLANRDATLAGRLDDVNTARRQQVRALRGEAEAVAGLPGRDRANGTRATAT